MMRRSLRKRSRALDDESESVDGAQDEPVQASPVSFHGALGQYQYEDSESTNTSADASQQSTKGATSVVLDPKDRRRPQPTTSKQPSPAKRRKSGLGQSSKYAAPSKYAHLPYLSDVLAPNLLILFIGLNPGITTSESGHAYAHPSNLFWKLLFSSGITDRRCAPQEDVNMPRLFSCGFTNIVGRPTKDQAELSRAEMVQGAPALESKANEWKPEVCCLVGKGIWEAVYRSKHGKAQAKDAFRYGWQDESENMGRDASWAGARVFVAASTSGASASLRPPEKEAIWKPLGEWSNMRRAERALQIEI